MVQAGGVKFAETPFPSGKLARSDVCGASESEECAHRNFERALRHSRVALVRPAVARAHREVPLADPGSRLGHTGCPSADLGPASAHLGCAFAANVALVRQYQISVR